MKTPKAQDETLFCQRCGISFLWSVEEQNQAALDEPLDAPAAMRPAKPLHCPGCRQLLPPADYERGLVKWYNSHKRYGFITRQHKPELYVHGSAILPGSNSTISGGRRLAPGDLVEFRLGANERGEMAVDVRILEEITN